MADRRQRARVGATFGRVRPRLVTTHPDVCEIYELSGPRAPGGSSGPQAPPDVLVELPHGATRLAHLAAAKALTRAYPGARYDKFFLANTDQGSPEYGLRFAAMITDPDGLARLPGIDPALADAVRERVARLRVLVIRCLIPRTIADVNRVWATELDFRAAGLTGVIAPFVTDPAEVAAIKARFDAYQAVTRAAYAEICGDPARPGRAFNLHTYAPISVSQVEGEPIVDTLERAYDPANYPGYPRRPEVELITATPEGEVLADPELCAAVVRAYRAQGVDIHENDPFNLHPATATAAMAAAYRGRVLCVEISRAKLHRRFDPFIEMEVDPEKIEAMTAPLALGLLERLAAEG